MHIDVEKIPRVPGRSLPRTARDSKRPPWSEALGNWGAIADPPTRRGSASPRLTTDRNALRCVFSAPFLRDGACSRFSSVLRSASAAPGRGGPVLRVDPPPSGVRLPLLASGARGFPATDPRNRVLTVVRGWRAENNGGMRTSRRAGHSEGAGTYLGNLYYGFV